MPLLYMRKAAYSFNCCKTRMKGGTSLISCLFPFASLHEVDCEQALDAGDTVGHVRDTISQPGLNTGNASLEPP